MSQLVVKRETLYATEEAAEEAGMKQVTATIGWTKSDMDNGYSSFSGYEAWAEQHEETITFDVPEDFDAERICWVLMEATNAPFLTLGSPAEAALSAIQATGYQGEEAHYSLSRGDTVTIDGSQYEFTGYEVLLVPPPSTESLK